MNDSKIHQYLNEQINNFYWKKNNPKNIINICVYKAFLECLNFYTLEFLNYIEYNEKNFQFVLFKTFIKILKNNLPYHCNGNVILDINDKNLNIFQFTDEFSSIVNNNGFVQNTSNKIYISKSGNVKKYFIGKINSIKLDTGSDISDHIEKQSFNKIKFGKSLINKKIVVNYQAMIPHYQSGVMNIINRIKLEIKKYVKQYI